MKKEKDVVEIKNNQRMWTYGWLLLTLFAVFSSAAVKIAEDKEDTGAVKSAGSFASNNKIIYLTFDDGPTSPVTENILNVLKEKNVKATFFVIGSKVKIKQDLIKRMHREGHTIGLHTFTHDYSKIYRSQNAFVEEMDRSEKEIYDVLGIHTTCIRFPTGSKGHLNRQLYERLNMKGYRIFDWNARITDGVHPNLTPATFFKEAISTGKKRNTVFMLMHCDVRNKNTCKALPRIIDFFKYNDYVFQRIESNTPEYFFNFEKNKK